MQKEVLIFMTSVSAAEALVRINWRLSQPASIILRMESIM